MRLSLCLLVAACGGTGVLPDASPTADASLDAGRVVDPSPGCGQPTTLPSGVTTRETMTFDGRERSWAVRLPAGYDGSPRPIVFVLHGGVGTSDQIAAQSGFDAIADREQAIVVYPNGIAVNESATNPLVRAQTWNAGACCANAMEQNVDDVGFLTAVLDRMEAATCLDRSRVFFTGMSNGGMMSYRMGCERADRVTAIAPVAGSLQLPTCTPARPVALFAIHGSLDPSVRYDGGIGCGPGMVDTQPIPTIVADWATRNQCTGEPSTVFSQGDGTCVASGTCAAETVLCTIAGGNHSWPGSATAPIGGCGDLGGRPSTTFFATEAIWAFFARH